MLQGLVYLWWLSTANAVVNLNDSHLEALQTVEWIKEQNFMVLHQLHINDYLQPIKAFRRRALLSASLKDISLSNQWLSFVEARIRKGRCLYYAEESNRTFQVIDSLQEDGLAELFEPIDCGVFATFARFASSCSPSRKRSQKLIEQAQYYQLECSQRIRQSTEAVRRRRAVALLSSYGKMTEEALLRVDIKSAMTVFQEYWQFAYSEQNAPLLKDADSLQEKASEAFQKPLIMLMAKRIHAYEKAWNESMFRSFTQMGNQLNVSRTDLLNMVDQLNGTLALAESDLDSIEIVCRYNHAGELCSKLKLQVQLVRSHRERLNHSKALVDVMDHVKNYEIIERKYSERKAYFAGKSNELRHVAAAELLGLVHDAQMEFEVLGDACRSSRTRPIDLVAFCDRMKSLQKTWKGIEKFLNSQIY